MVGPYQQGQAISSAEPLWARLPSSQCPPATTASTTTTTSTTATNATTSTTSTSTATNAYQHCYGSLCFPVLCLFLMIPRNRATFHLPSLMFVAVRQHLGRAPSARLKPSAAYSRGSPASTVNIRSLLDEQCVFLFAHHQLRELFLLNEEELE